MSKAVSRRFRCALILLALCAIGGSTAQATRADSGQSASPPYVRVCNAPLSGELACLALRRTTAPIASLPAGLSPAAAAAAVSGYGPADLVSAYKLPTSQGSGKLVAIVDAYDDPSVASDLATYRSQFGLPACTTANGCFRKINQSGGTTPPTADSGWAGEIALDVEMVSATCPLCRILLVEATSPTIANLGAAVNQAVAQGAVVVSNSYGGPESSGDPTTSNSYYKHAGVAITVSSGDSGYGVEFPASSPYVTSVGGTSLARSSNTRGWAETAWNGAGSGCSSYEAKPSFQTDSGCARRTVADVSAIADPNTGVAVYDSYGSGGWAVYGGTSVAAPVVAGTYALATAPNAGDFPNAYPYANRSALFDVTSGSNGSCSGSYLCTATAGYDGPTGLGTPNGVAAFGPSGTPPPPTNDFSVGVSPTSGSVTAGSSTTATVSTAVTAGSAQTVSFTASGVPSGASVSFAPTSVAAGGSSTMTISTGSSTAAGTYTITITGTASSGSHTTAYSLTVKSAGGGTCSSGQKLANPGFESGATGWSASSGVIGNSGATPHSGSYFAWLDGYGTTHTDTLSQSVAIPAGCSSYTLSFWLRITTSERTTTTAYDKLTVKLGSTTLATYSNLNSSSGYVQRSFNVSGFAGQTVAVSFSGTEDSSLATSFFVDDTALTVG
jgi:hypothetical protein